MSHRSDAGLALVGMDPDTPRLLQPVARVLLRLNQALIGEMSSAKALNTAAKDMEEVFRKGGRRTGGLTPLPE